ncbi:major facilitator superfamily domain-containing protein [Schizophyllum fasciatum]
MSREQGTIALDSRPSSCHFKDASDFTNSPLSRTPDPESPPNTSTATVNESALYPADRGIHAWLFMVAAFFIEAIAWSFPFSYGVFLESYLDNPVYASQKNAASLLPLVGTISSGIQYCSGPFLYPIIIRYPRMRLPAVWIGATLCAVSLFAASYTTQIVTLVALQGVLYAIGGALLYTPTILFMSEWFIRLRGTASGIIFAGTSVGGLILPLVFPPVIAKHGAPYTLRIFAISIACMLLPLLPFNKGRLPITKVRGPAPRAKDRDFLKNWSFWIYMIVDLIQGFGYFMPIVWLPTFASDLSLSSLQSAIALAALNGASVIGGLYMGYLSDRWNAWALALGSLFATALATFILWGVLGSTFAGLIAFGIVYGIVAGGFSTLWTTFARTYAKEEPGLSSTLFGYISMCRGIGNVLSTPIATALIGKSAQAMVGSTGFAVGDGRFGSMIIYSGTCFAGAAGLAVFGWRSDMWALRRQ